MTVYYVGPGGSDGSSGTSWANRKLTLNGAEDVPVTAGDTVYVGPGVYRELLTCDVSGTSGNQIRYIGDVTGENTDGVGGIVRVTGSNDDQTRTRANCFFIGARDFRTFRGFKCDMTTGAAIESGTGRDTIIVEDCVVQTAHGGGSQCIRVGGTNLIFRRCVIIQGRRSAAGILVEGTETNTGNLIENCLIMAIQGAAYGIWLVSGGNTIKNCTIIGGNRHVNSAGLPATPTANNVNNCILQWSEGGSLVSDTAGELVEDYNTFWGNLTNRTNVSTGTNSVTYPALFTPPLLLSGYKFPWPFGSLLPEWSQVARIAGTGESSDDLFGITRPTTSAKKSWGAVQVDDVARETGTVDAGSVSLKMADAGRTQFRVPVTNTSTTISVKVYREASYAGTNPQMVIKQPGQADDTTTDVGSSATWNTLSTTLTPASTSDFVIVELVSNNTATAGSYAVFFDTFSVS